MKPIVFLFLFTSLNLWSQSNFEKGMQFFEQKKYVQAKPFFEEVIRQNPKNYEAIDKLGEVSVYTKNWDEAVRCGYKLKTVFPNNADYWYKYGGALGLKAKNSNKFKALGMIDDVKEAFETSANLDPKHIGVRWAMVMFYIELPGIIGGSEAKSQKYANELMRISKVDGFLAKGYIDVYFERYAAAEMNYKKAHEIGHSKTTFEKLYDLYLNKIKDEKKAAKLKADFDK
ncbi:tetratricopeptide repeat protein [Flavobacterium amnicola]|uniref:Tetratricopeptide repeat protein n=2 Tax=Flavobacterium amnicola TaxID=2506422 RepID=A0A4Q1K4C1_9FLAO|nr:tetratricopeptide repeat protein [Flavobacterium amnicola]